MVYAVGDRALCRTEAQTDSLLWVLWGEALLDVYHFGHIHRLEVAEKTQRDGIDNMGCLGVKQTDRR